MDKLVQTSVDNFIKELQMRIRIMQSPSELTNLDQATYEQVNKLISEAIGRPSNTLKTNDFLIIEYPTVEQILTKIGVREDVLKRIKQEYQNNIYLFKTSLNKTRLIEVTKFFEELKKMIENYLNDYQNLNINQADMRSNKVNEYTQYIHLLEQGEFLEPFDTLDELLKLMNNLAIAIEDKWRILTYIANQNISYGQKEFSNINLARKIYVINDRFIDPDEDIASVIKKKLELVDDIDIDLIPKLSRIIAQDENLELERTQNIICALLLNSLFESYKKEAAENTEALSIIEENMQSILEYCKFEESTVVKEARIIVMSTQEFFLRNNSEKINQYVDLSINEIMNSHNVSRDTAIDLKTLPVLKSISETLDKIDRLSEQSEDYELCCGVLDELVNAYNHLVDKKGIKGLTIKN